MGVAHALAGQYARDHYATMLPANARRVLAMKFSFLLLLLFATSSRLHAQAPTWQPSITPGREVRVHSDNFAAPLRGEWRGVERDSARVSLGGGALVAVSTPSILRIDENLGRQRARGALIGGAVGMLVGGFGLALSVENDDLAQFTGFIAGALTGLVFGAPIGFLWAPHRWTTHMNPQR